MGSRCKVGTVMPSRLPPWASRGAQDTTFAVTALGKVDQSSREVCGGGGIAAQRVPPPASAPALPWTPLWILSHPRAGIF